MSYFCTALKLFTIVTVTWNVASVIGPTLQSVRQQTCRDYEYLVVDGASKDRTLDLVREANIEGTRIYSEPDKGLYDAMNKAIRLAEGKYLIWLNAGDRFAAPDSLARLAAHAEGNPGVIYGQTQLVDATGPWWACGISRHLLNSRPTVSSKACWCVIRPLLRAAT